MQIVFFIQSLARQIQNFSSQKYFDGIGTNAISFSTYGIRLSESSRDQWFYAPLNFINSLKACDEPTTRRYVSVCNLSFRDILLAPKSNKKGLGKWVGRAKFAYSCHQFSYYEI